MSFNFYRKRDLLVLGSTKGLCKRALLKFGKLWLNWFWICFFFCSIFFCLKWQLQVRWERISKIFLQRLSLLIDFLGWRKMFFESSWKGFFLVFPFWNNIVYIDCYSHIFLESQICTALEITITNWFMRLVHWHIRR